MNLDLPHKSFMDSPFIGSRPHKGLASLINKEIKLNKYEHFDDHISYISFNLSDENFLLIGVYLLFNSNTGENKVIYDSQLIFIQELLNNITYKNHTVIILEDFNADLSRLRNHHDINFKNFVKENNLTSLGLKVYKKNYVTFQNAEKCSGIDHIVVRKKDEKIFKNFLIVNSEFNMSDHNFNKS
jgi:hypothetical protein